MRPYRPAAADHFSMQWFNNSGYDVHLIAPSTRLKIHVVLALCRCRDRRDFKCAFFGSGADFSISHAATQAFVELSRNAFFGEVARCKQAQDAIALRSNDETPKCQQRVLAVSLPKGEAHIGPLIKRAEKASHYSEGTCKTFRPEDAIAAILSEGHEIMLCPMHQDHTILPGYCYKFIIPGFGTTSGIIHAK